jgi:predicted RNase H-like HicB family nuclease
MENEGMAKKSVQKVKNSSRNFSAVERDAKHRFSTTMKKFDVVFERDESGYVVALVPELPGCHTQGKTLSEATAKVKEAIELYLEVAAANGKAATRNSWA